MGLPGGSSEWDVFISYASEDRDSLAKPLAGRLRRQGLRVWYDEFELHVGDKLRRKIEYGLSKSRFGVVILSKRFFEKKWPQHELDTLFALEDRERSKILPVWHKLSVRQIRGYAPSLLDRKAVSTEIGIPAVAASLVATIRRNDSAPQEVSRHTQPSLSDVQGEAESFVSEHPRCDELVEAIRSCLSSKSFPTEMNINGKSFYNPIYDNASPGFVRVLSKRPCRFMPLDIFLIKARDQKGEPFLLQYFSGNTAFGWQCWLFPHGFRPEKKSVKQRFLHNARDFEIQCRLENNSCSVQTVKGWPFAVTIKPDFGYKDNLVCYVLAFCRLTMTKVPQGFAKREFVVQHTGASRSFQWMSVDEMSQHRETFRRNADLHRCIHQLYAKTLIEIPYSFKRRIRAADR